MRSKRAAAADKKKAAKPKLRRQFSLQGFML
jgi:hypothetical protein